VAESPATIDLLTECTATGSVVAVVTPATIDLDTHAAMPAGFDEWRAVLVDHSGATLAFLPAPQWGTLVEQLNETATVELGFDPAAVEHAAAAAVIRNADPLPSVEVQVWRGMTLVFWGPVVDATIDERAVVMLHARDASWHLSKSLIGPLGGDELFTNPSFAAGLSGWGVAKVHLTNGTDVGLLSVTPGDVDTPYSVNLPGGGPVLHIEGGSNPDTMYHVYQDVLVAAPAHRDITLRLYGAVWVPANGDAGVPNVYAPNTPRFGLYMEIPADPSAAAGGRWWNGAQAADTLSGEVVRDRWVNQYCELKVPA
jgi:hypothetical protein